ncbi:hypothetical protein SOVF_172930 [Spinacia oleracea]|uniref:RNase H type-1 domain-containing protein n=1 Tax=Spinacia oleracea TaxID=3562 RepID=A0A9R0JCB4_SPIOL|nr:uncharacterized protein LOC110803946 [Spinacia oleracea]KNA07332.1 hypothetical protein SOVF_172930 [Spinacia oleracea]
MDASWKQDSLIAGLAGTVRDNQGKWIIGFHGKAMADSSLMAKLLAIRESIRIGIEQAWTGLILSSDCKEAVELINSNVRVTGNYINLVLDCRELKNQLLGSLLRFEGRGTNKLADHMARKARADQSQIGSIDLLFQPQESCNDLYLSELQPVLDVNSRNFHESVP